MTSLFILLCLILFMYVLVLERKMEPFEDQTQKDLDIAEQAALEIDKLKKQVDLNYNTILQTKKEIGPVEVENNKAEFINMHNDMKADYKKAELEMLRAEVASPRSGPTVRSREAMVHMKNMIDNIKI